MRAEYYTIWGEKVMLYTDLEEIPIEHDPNQPPLEVAIGIDPSTSTTGFTMGRVDMDFPFLGMQFVREPDETHFSYVVDMIDYIIYNVIGYNNVTVTHIFTEDKYEGGQKYNRHTIELLSMVKTGVTSLPSRIKQECMAQLKTPTLVMMKPSEWRKIYLKEYNTNAKRNVMKKIVGNFTLSKYNLNYNNIFQEDLIESIGIYSAGFQKYVEPTLANSRVGKVDFSNMDWRHKIVVHKIINRLDDALVRDMISNDPVMSERAKKYGLKAFEYERGNSLEKNIRGLTSYSNAIFLTILDTWDLESIPVYYELRKTPLRGQKLIILGYREIEKSF